MARHESDREDILREATALVERAELIVPGESEPIVIGFRRDGAASVFFGGDPVYQFNAAGELRRAYARGLLYKAEKGQLVELRRQRTASEVHLLRRELSADECDAFLHTATSKLRQISAAVLAREAHIKRQVPAEADVSGRIRTWLSQLPEHLAVAHSPRAR